MKVAVIGGGVMGLSCAWRLTEGGCRVELFESRTCGGGATLASLGALWPASPLANGPLQELHRRALWGYEAFVRDLSERGGMAVAFRRGGRIEILNSMKAIARAQAEAAYACQHRPRTLSAAPVMEVLDTAGLAREFPALAPAKFGALRCRATAQVRVPLIVEALVRVCQARGVMIHERTTAPSIEQMDADKVLVCAGAWTTVLGGPMASAASIAPAKGQGIALRAATSSLPDCIVKSGKTYLVPWPEEVLVGSTTEPEAGYDETPTDAARVHLHQTATAIAPALADARVVRHWAGLRPDAPHHQPIMGPINEKVFICAGHYKTGIGLAPLVSEFIARALLTGQIAAELAPFLPQM